MAQVTGAVALTALLVSPWWSAIPSEEPIAARPHPFAPLPTAVAPSPALVTRPAVVEEPVRPAHLNLDVRHSFGGVDLSVEVDGKSALDTKVDGGGKRFKMFGKRAERGFTSTIDLAPGVRVVRVRVRSAADKFDQTRVERFDLASASIAAINITADKSGLTLVAERPPAPPAPVRPVTRPVDRSPAVPSITTAPPVIAPAAAAAAAPVTQQQANTVVDLLQSLRSMLIAIAGFVASAATGVVVQEYMRSRRALFALGGERRRKRRQSKAEPSV